MVLVQKPCVLTCVFLKEAKTFIFKHFLILRLLFPHFEGMGKDTQETFVFL